MAALGLGGGFHGTGAKDEIWKPWDLKDKLIHWYKWNNQITKVTVGSDANMVSKWADVVGGNHLVPTDVTDVSEMPQWQTDGTLLFDQNTDSLRFNSAVSVSTYSIYFKHKFKTGETISGEVMMETESADSIKIHTGTETRIKNATRHDFTTKEIDAGTAYVFGLERRSTGDMMVYIDNTASSAADGDSLNVTTSNAFELAQVGDANNDSYWYEIVICNDALADHERNALYHYLNGVGG
tara:strand:+ start:231 stop:947 length:717 start_codon:yes stop_codon:yes gene_type:complete